MSKLPPGVVKEKGQLVRYVTRISGDGSEWRQRRPVALTLEEAKAKKCDYYHPEIGWVLGGYKLEKDRPVESIMADNSQSVAVSIGQQEEESKEAPSG